MTQASFTPILLGGDQNVYGMARSIHEKYGITSTCIARIQFPVTQNSKLLHCIAVENFDRPDIFVKTLRELAPSFAPPRLLLSCGDNYTALLSKCGKELEDLYRFNVPRQELIASLCEKDAFYNTCEAHQLKYPKTRECTYETKDNFVCDLSFPVVVKAADSVSYWKCSFAGKKKVFVAADHREMQAIIAAVYSSEYRHALIIQEFIPGADDCMRMINAYCKKGGGVRFISLGHIILEEHTAQGIGSYAAIMGGKDDEFCLRIKNFLETIGYEGYVNIDIKRDPRSGEYNFFEINPRQGRSSYFVTASGHNLAQFVVEDLILEAPGEFEIGHGECVWSIVPKGIISRYVMDEATKKEIARQQKIGGFIRHLDYKKDRSVRRRLSFMVNQYHYFKKYKENFNKKGFFNS